MTDSAIPVIDISSFASGGETARRALARQIDTACRETGFFTIIGHGVPDELMTRTRQAAVHFFALPEAEKLKVERPPRKISRGYNRLGDRSLSYSLGIPAPPDIQEAFAFGPEKLPDQYDGEAPDAMLAPNLWPAHEMKPVMMDYYGAMVALGDRVLRIMAAALEVDEHFFDDKFDHQSSVVRLIRYPAQTGAPLAGQLRAGEHTDYGAVTFVRGDDVPGGLQVRNIDGKWMDVHPPAGGFVCNIGDTLARWTNDRWISTLHRVANPPGEAASVDRISLVFFQMPNDDAHISCIESCIGGGAKYPATTYTAHYMEKLMKAAHARLDADTADAG